MGTPDFAVATLKVLIENHYTVVGVITAPDKPAGRGRRLHESAVKQYAKAGEFDKNSKIVVIFPDHGSRYMSKVYSDAWMHEQGFFDSQKQENSTIEFIK